MNDETKILTPEQVADAEIARLAREYVAEIYAPENSPSSVSVTLRALIAAVEQEPKA